MHLFKNNNFFKLNLSSMNSVYIPHIPVAYTSEMVMNIFHLFTIGQVDRVDFLAPHEMKPNIRQAFVHFKAYNSFIVSAMLLKHAAHQAYRLVVDNEGHYWDLCENKNPVPETYLNIHQLAENMRILQNTFETKIAELTAKLAVIPQMQEEIATLKNRIKYLEDPEWLLSTGSGFAEDSGPLTTSMLNESGDREEGEVSIEYDDECTTDLSSCCTPTQENVNGNCHDSRYSTPVKLRDEIEKRYMNHAQITPIKCSVYDDEINYSSTAEE
jgi:hypothetical protein